MSYPLAAITCSRSPYCWISFSPFFGPIPETPGLKSVPIMMHTSTSCSLVTPRSFSILPVSMISGWTVL